jgi:hypothetical protein
MNERIRELADEAGLRFTQLMSNPMVPVVDGKETDLEKFAELIVKECMDAVREQYLPVLEDELMMKDTHWDGYVQCGVDSYVAIKQHFGVEE